MTICIINKQFKIEPEIQEIFKKYYSHETILVFGSLDEFESISKFTEKLNIFILEIANFSSCPMQGMEIIQNLKKQYPTTHVVVYSSLEYEEWGDLCREAGADYFLSKNIGANILIKICEHLLTAVPDEAASLTKRQKEIIKYLAKGYNNAMIGEVLSLNERTVKVHAGRLYKRIGVQNRTQAALYALKFNLD